MVARGAEILQAGNASHNDDYTDEFPKSDYAYLERGIMLTLSNGNVLYLEEYIEDLVLISRGKEEDIPRYDPDDSW